MTQAHSLLGASGAHRWLNCPGSFALSQQTAQHRPPSVYAARGTAAHEYIERAKKTGFHPVKKTELGKEHWIEGHAIEVDQDLLDGVNIMLDYLYEAVGRAEWVDVEFRVKLDRYFRDVAPPVQMFGTVDAAIYEHPGMLEIVDYKNGSGVAVSPRENPQLLYYAAGVLKERFLPRDVQNVRLTIVQPHASGLDPIRSWDLDPVDVVMWVDDVLIPGVQACAAPNAPLVPGTWCRFCPVSHACPALHQAAVAAAQTEFDAIENAPADRLAAALDTAERAELWIERLREFAIDRLKSQERIPGWGLVPTRATRKWTQDEASIVDALKNAGLSNLDIFETRMRSPAQLEKELNRTRSGRVIWSAEIQDQNLVEARSSGVKLARTDTADAREEFDDVG